MLLDFLQKYKNSLHYASAQTKQKPTETKQYENIVVSSQRIMYRLKEYWNIVNLPEPSEPWDGNIVCVETDAKMTFGTNLTQGYLACYTFTLITEGWLTLVYNNHKLTLHKGDVYLYSPGLEVTVLAASDDYRGICLLADEQFTLELPSVHDSIRATYLSVVELQQPQLTLNDADYRHFHELLQLTLRYQQSSLPYADESLRMLYGIFLNDLTGMMERSIREHRFPKRVEELFQGFLHLLPRNFAEHHDIGFYASELCITTTYLSRIVRQVSGGRTVIDYINQLLLMEATFLLRQTSLSVAQIAEQLHFAETTTFARFFQRMKGMTPKEFRKGK